MSDVRRAAVAAFALALAPGCGNSSSPSPGLSGKSSADAGSVLCKNPSSALLAFYKCAETRCAMQTAAGNSACPASQNPCYGACECSDAACIEACDAKSPSACVAAQKALEECTGGAGCLPDAGAVAFPETAVPFVGALPATAPKTCRGMTYFVVTGLADKCGGGKVYLLCGGSTFTEFSCESPGASWVATGS